MLSVITSTDHPSIHPLVCLSIHFLFTELENKFVPKWSGYENMNYFVSLVHLFYENIYEEDLACNAVVYQQGAIKITLKCN